MAVGGIKFGDRIRSARVDAGIKSQSELARRLGITRAAVSEWENGNSEPSAKQIRNISLLTGVSYEWLATGRGDRQPKTIMTIGARVIGAAEAEVWREGQSVTQAKLARDDDVSRPLVPSVPRPDLAGMRQFAIQARGTSANRTVQPGEYVICVEYQEMRPSGPQAGDLVVVEKRRGGNSEFKVLIARLRFIAGAWELHYESNDPRWQNEPPLRLSEDLKSDSRDHNPIEIVGGVLGVFRYDPQPI